MTTGEPGAWLKRDTKGEGNAFALHRVKRGLDRVVHGSPCDESRGGAPKGERARKRMVRASGSSVARAAPAAFADGNIRECGAAVDDAPSGAPPPFFVEARFVPCRCKTRMRMENAPRE